MQHTAHLRVHLRLLGIHRRRRHERSQHAIAAATAAATADAILLVLFVLVLVLLLVVLVGRGHRSSIPERHAIAAGTCRRRRRRPRRRSLRRLETKQSMNQMLLLTGHILSQLGQARTDLGHLELTQLEQLALALALLVRHRERQLLRHLCLTIARVRGRVGRGEGLNVGALELPSGECAHGRLGKLSQALAQRHVADAHHAHHFALRTPEAMHTSRDEQRRAADTRGSAARLDPVALHALHEAQRRH